jgi:hypothetical protein
MLRLIIQLGRSGIILSFIIAMGAIFGYLSYSGMDEPVVETGTEVVISREELESLKNFNIDFSILSDETYKALEVFGENPVDPGAPL